MEHWMKGWLRRALFLLPFLLLLIGCQGGESPSLEASPSEEEFSKKVVVTRPKLQKVVHYERGVGTFIPYEEVMVSSEIVGRIEKIFVDEGRRVKKGDVLARVEQERFLYEVKKAEAQLAKAQQELVNSKATLERQKKLFEQGVIGEQDYEDFLNESKVYDQEEKEAVALLKLAKKDYKDTLIISPLNGIINERLISEGEHVEEDDNLFHILQIGPLKFSFTAPEKSASYLRLQAEIKVEVEAYPGEEFTGKVYFIAPFVEENIRALRLKALFDNPDERLRPGFFGHVKLILDGGKESFVLPEKAVLIREEGPYIFVVDGDEVARKKPVTIGYHTEDGLEITSGVSKDDLVIMEGNQELLENSKVKILREI